MDPEVRDAAGGTGKTCPASDAVALMELALQLLDEAGELTAAARLQHAIDSVSTAARVGCA